MPVISTEDTIAANALSDNVLSGELFEFLPRPCVISLLATGSAAGLRIHFAIGGEILVDDAVLNTQNRVPITPDDLILTDGGRAGERLVLRFRNTTAGALVARAVVQIQPVG